MQPADDCQTSKTHPVFLASALLVVLGFLTACATVASRPTGSSEPAFVSANEIPRRVSLRTSMVGQDDPIQRVLSAELPRLGFTLDYEGPDGVFIASTLTSDLAPSSLELTLIAESSGRVLWTARVVREWDIYASVNEAHEQNARKALELLERDLAQVGFTTR